GFLEEGGVTEGIPDTSEGFLVEYSINEDDFTIEKPAHWVGRRSAPGEIQEKLSDLLIAQHRFEQALRAWDNRLADIEQQLAEAQGELAFSEKELESADEAHATKIGLSAAISTLRASQLLHEGLSKFAEKVAETEAVCLPMFMIAGAASGGDTTSVARCERKLVGLGIGEALAGAARVEEVAQSQLELAMDLVGDQAELDIKHANFDLTVLKSAEELKILVRGEPQLRANVHEAAEVVRKAADA